MTNRLITCHVFEGRLVGEAPWESKRRQPLPNPPAVTTAAAASQAASVYDAAAASAAAAMNEATVSEAIPEPYATVESGWFTPAEAARLPLAASARKTLADILGEPAFPIAVRREGAGTTVRPSRSPGTPRAPV